MNKKINILAIAVLTLIISSCGGEHSKFRKAREANTIGALKDFASNYPNSDYIDDVKAIIENLIWDSIQKVDIVCAYEDYIDAHPKSRFTDSAKQMIKRLKPIDEFDEEANDVDCNLYKVVNIAGRNWMAENLRATRFNDKTPIDRLEDGQKWQTAKSAAYTWYNNDGANSKYPNGALYNWYAVESGKLCPKGWHVPTKAEWEQLIKHLGGNKAAVFKMKSPGDGFWTDGNDKSTNSSGFSALGIGIREGNGEFIGMGEMEAWWSSDSIVNAEEGIAFGMGKQLDNGQFAKNTGKAVRCIEDAEEEDD
jgi:uncharacterized protein (TIGR02145 family)